MISDFLHKAAENYHLLGHYTVNSGNFFLTVWDNLSVPKSCSKSVSKKLLLLNT